MTDIDFERIFKSLPGLFLVLRPDAQFTVLAASDAYLHATGIGRRPITGRGLFDVFRDAAQETQTAGLVKLRSSLQQVLDKRVEDAMGVQRYDLPRSEGGENEFEERYWNPVNTPAFSASGEIEYIIHRVEDATDRVHASRNLHANDILESITEGFYALDRNWRFTYVNREAQRIVGGKRNDLVGKVVWDVYPGLADSKFEHAYRRAMDHGEPASLTDYYPDHGRWYEVHCYPSPAGASIYFRDVSAQKRAEAEQAQLVASSEQQRRVYEVALSNTPDLVYVFDLDHRFTYANEALLTMWGKTREESLGRTCLELGYEPWHAEMHDREIEQVVTTRQPIRGEVPFSGTGGRRIYDYIFSPVLGEHGDVVAVAGTTRDITDRQQAEQAIREQAEQLRQADRAKDEFLATLSHELRNPLAPLRNSLSLLRLGQNSNPAIRPVHEMMERQVNHLVRLVDDLLEMSRISRGALVLRKERVQVADVVNNAMETIEPLIRAAGHSLSLSMPDEALWLEGDPVRLGQILANLLDNAAKYTPDGGQISVGVRRRGESVDITVRDNGMGISAEDLPRMFEMFSRGDDPGARGQEGLGIGLALSRRLAEMHGGTLLARSEGQDKGSEFTAHFPLATDQTALAIAQASPPPVAPQRILLVDDNHDAADSLATLLELLGAEVRIAHEGMEALAAFASFGPSVVLLDIGMPGMNGYEVARAIRTRHPASGVSIIALTGWGQEDDRRRAREAGFDHHLTKPVEIETLQTVLADLGKGKPSPRTSA